MFNQSLTDRQMDKRTEDRLVKGQTARGEYQIYILPPLVENKKCSNKLQRNHK